MQAGNATYEGPDDLPGLIPVFPLPEALLLPRGQMPLSIFEPRYLAMVDHAMAGDRIIGMVQPMTMTEDGEDAAELFAVGCAGRITSYSETGDGRYMICLTGISRFRILEEVEPLSGFRQCRVSAADFPSDFVEDAGSETVDRGHLLDTFRQYLDANQLEADWDSIEKASNETLVNALSMMSPYGMAEKQALLEAPDLRTRAETLIALTEISLARRGDGTATSQLQ
ncbi:MAG: LON peptidase substrate-binding domain-containing protein [Candidatus Kaistia colombiensis]|nr:MAG: LON peptidase substrate-binding domain-containing protein [Kaistia sp.]